MQCNSISSEVSSSKLIAYETSLNDAPVTLYNGYDAAGLHFKKDLSKYLLKLSSTFTPAYDSILCPFLMEWQPSVNLQQPTENVPEAVIPPNYVLCEDSCDSLKNETGVKFGSKDFKPVPESLKDVPISNASNFIRLLKLPQEIAESMKSETTIKIGHTSVVEECNETLKLLVGNGVGLLFPKSVAPNSTVEPINSITAANTNETRNSTTSKSADKTEEASFPLWAIILICW
uniref:Uncharacterized protein n=1 Tax=Panagrolaimus sp. PS1159 TaxID=55785 RepID=A0AC35EXA7_9BILA